MSYIRGNSKVATKKNNKNLKFEEALALLETNVEQLETGNLPLEEALEVFKQGVELSQSCLAKLNAAQEEVQKVVELNNGEYEYKLLAEVEG
ncbi:MAG: exodeoxyribonuclease VII small subunit [Acidaminococcaceae bacterium]